MNLSDEKYIAATTYRKNGDPVTTPTWVVALDDDRIGFWTSSATGKAKRLRATPADHGHPERCPGPGSSRTRNRSRARRRW